MLEQSPESPERRRKRRDGDARRRRAMPARVRQVIARVALGVYSDGFIHAGNLAYLALLALFPFILVATTIARLLGSTSDGLDAINAFLLTVPPSVADALRAPIAAVLTAQSDSGILWLSLGVGLWTTASLIETVRDILRRAYGTRAGRPFWHYRLLSIASVMLTSVLIMTALSAQLALIGAQEFVIRVFPFAEGVEQLIAASKLVPMLIVFCALLVLFISLTPGAYRGRAFPKWPGALFTTLWWYLVLMLLPPAIAHFANYDLTYGSLAGVMVTLIFFFLVGLGVVIGAELNAALADFPDPDDMRRGRQAEEKDE